MTQPTQAQIEAAAMAMKETGDVMNWPLLAKAALTAAAQAEKECETCGGLGYRVHDPDGVPYPVQCPDCAPAAAQVDPTLGDPRWRDIAGQGIQTEFQLRKEMLTLEATTIERCAQVAEKNAFANEAGDVWRHAFNEAATQIAAAIRALKDPA